MVQVVQGLGFRGQQATVNIFEILIKNSDGKDMALEIETGITSGSTKYRTLPKSPFSTWVGTHLQSPIARGKSPYTRICRRSLWLEVESGPRDFLRCTFCCVSFC